MAEDIVVTNQHVAALFAYKSGEGKFDFLENFEGRLVSASIDFVREYKSNVSREFLIVEVLHIEDPNGPDIALLPPSTPRAIATPRSWPRQSPSPTPCRRPRRRSR